MFCCPRCSARPRYNPSACSRPNADPGLRSTPIRRWTRRRCATPQPQWPRQTASPSSIRRRCDRSRCRRPSRRVDASASMSGSGLCVRLRQDLPDEPHARLLSHGAEVDAFRVAVIRRFPRGWTDPETAAKNDVTRQSVYAAWLIERFGDAVVVEQCALVAFRRTRAIRGLGRAPEGPDATLHGTFVVSNPKVFAQVLRHGVGRHRAYGYGMLLLRPPNHLAAER